MPKPQPKKGRPASKAKRVRVTIDLDPKTHAKLTELREKDGRSFGRLVDVAVFALTADLPKPQP